MSRKSLWTWIIVVIILVAAIIVIISLGGDKQSSTSSTYNQNPSVVTSTNSGENVIEITSSGFSPNSVTITQGTTVTFVNKNSIDHWPASGMHPTHTIYPGVNYDDGKSYAGSKGCISEGQSKTGAFDACKGIKPGESWSFTFNQKGNWPFHDHLNTGSTGRITVN